MGKNKIWGDKNNKIDRGDGEKEEKEFGKEEKGKIRSKGRYVEIRGGEKNKERTASKYSF